MTISRAWRRPTLGAVAARAGVSTATVSHALDGTGRLSDATRQRVLAAAREPGHARCAERDMAVLVEGYATLPDHVTAEREAVGRLLDRDPRPDAVIGVYSDSGHDILAAARYRGLRVPRDLLVACISEDPDYATTTPPITTVSLRPDEVGEQAVDLLIALINGRRGVTRRRLVQPLLTARRSTQRSRAGSGTS
ncbi:substrate-binding domain-containing protein [Streptomyces djakartensis]|uniref:HTH lacI-type domain-containing protein n=1 Tax=Streptomyces djakartensis TaxID=68193 RepID=A0ABQ2ZX92_9ACTN|nr:substrate-binding domain-containing protein [Streptomyces djakartensis]GGY25283.1 hypothetical protein GCM10010384_35430 [Streptomyces djakartensis]